MRYFNKIDGDRIYLSPVNVGDYETYTKWINDLSTTVPLGNASQIINTESEKEFIKELAKSKTFAIIKKDGDQLIGNISLMDIEQLHQRATLGIMIGEKEERGKGYGSEAIELLLTYGFSLLNLNNIMLNVFSFNEIGISAYKKVGFKEFGRRHQAYKVNGTFYDDIHMEILSEDFKSKYIDKNFKHIL